MVSTRCISVYASLIVLTWLVGLPALQAAQEQPQSDTDRRTIMDYAHTHPIVLQRVGTVTRRPDEVWFVWLEGMDEGIAMEPLRGRTDIPKGTQVSGNLLLGAHGPFLALIVDVDDGQSVAAVMEFDQTKELLTVIGPDSPLRQLVRAGLSRAEALALKALTIRLRILFHNPAEGMVSFGPFALQSTDQQDVIGQECEGGTCSCFLGCSANCGAGSLPRCSCKVFNDECWCEQCVAAE